MAKLGAPKTKKFPIGTAELRVGPLSMANKLTQAHSVGLIDSANLEVSQEVADLIGGFPQTLVDTAITQQQSQITANLREYSRRNMNLLLGLGQTDFATDVATTITADAAAEATSLTVADAAGIAAGDMLVVYPTGRPENISVVRVQSVAALVLTLDANTPLLHALTTAVGAVVYKAQSLAVGNVQAAAYFAVQLLQRENSTGRPVGFNFWKGTLGGGMTFGTSASEFASTDLVIKLLEPAESEYAVGQPLAHLVDIIPSNPTGMFFGGGDI